jgi:hypothetical protein
MQAHQTREGGRMNYWIVKAALTAIELDAAQKDLIKAYRRRSPDADKYQQRWDSLSNEMQKLNRIVQHRADTY